METREGGHVGLIASANHPGQWNRTTSDSLDHQPVASGDPFITEGEAAELVIAVGIDPSVVEHDIWACPVEEGRQGLSDSPKVWLVLGPIRKANVQIRRNLPYGIVGLGMYGKGCYSRVSSKDRSCTVALVDVEVDYQGRRDQAFRLKNTDSDGDVVKHTEAGAAVAAGVMSPASSVASDPGAQS